MGLNGASTSMAARLLLDSSSLAVTTMDNNLLVGLLLLLHLHRLVLEQQGILASQLVVKHMHLPSFVAHMGLLEL
jgi:hypothetical protein